MKKEKKELPSLSIVFAAKTATEARHLVDLLNQQKYDGEVEYCYSTEGNIAHAMNKGVEMATNDLIIFTETDVQPTTEYWFLQMVQAHEQGHFVKSLEVNHQTPNFSGMIVNRGDLNGEKFDESFDVAEDTEFFARMKNKYGMEVKQAKLPSHFHLRSKFTKKMLKRARAYGQNEARIMKQHGNYSIDRYRNRQVLTIEIANEILRGIEDELSKG